MLLRAASALARLSFSGHFGRTLGRGRRQGRHLGGRRRQCTSRRVFAVDVADDIFFQQSAAGAGCRHLLGLQSLFGQDARRGRHDLVGRMRCRWRWREVAWPSVLSIGLAAAGLIGGLCFRPARAGAWARPASRWESPPDVGARNLHRRLKIADDVADACRFALLLQDLRELSASGAETSTVAFSDSISTSGSSLPAVSPSRFSHAPICTSVIDSPISGTRSSIGMAIVCFLPN